MKNILNISLLSLVVVFLSSCYDDKTNDSFSRLYVSGPTGGAPETSGSYSLGATPGTITWTIDDTSVASISSTSGTDAEVDYLKFGNFRITASNGTMEGWLDVAVTEVGAGVTASYHYGSVNNGGIDSLFLDFDSPLASTPEMWINGAFASDTSAYGGTLFRSAGDTITTLTAYPDSDTKYYALYTGGTDDGQAEGRLTKVTPDAAYSATVADSVYFKLQMVDNTQPNVLDNTNATGPVTWGSEVEYEVVFSEAMRATFATSADSAIWLHFDYTRKVKGVDTAVEDSVEFTSDDMMTWAASYVVSDSIDDLGVVALSRGLGEWVDVAGNSYIGNPLGAIAGLTIDKADPTLTSNSGFELGGQAAGADHWVQLDATATDAGIGVDVIHYMMKEAYESDTTAAGVHNLGPKELADFSGATLSATAGAVTTQILMSTDSARYDIFWIAVDDFGHASAIDSSRIAYDENGVFSYDD